MRKLKNIKIFRRSSKTVGCKDDCDSGDNGGIRVSTNEFEKQLEGYQVMLKSLWKLSRYVLCWGQQEF